MAATYSTLAERLSQIESSITTLQDNISNIKISPFRVVTTLPSWEVADRDVIYFVPSSQTGEENVYDEYAVIEGAFEKIGSYSTSVDLSQYVTQTQLKDMNTLLSQTINSIGALKVSKNLDDLGNLDTTVGSIAYYSYIAENPEEISSIKIGENTEAAVGKFFMANAIMPTTSGNIVIMFEGDPMSINAGQDPLFIVTLNADESLENLYATIESNLGFTVPDYFFESFGDDVDFESDGEYCEFPIIKDGEITKYGNLIFNKFFSLSNRCYISEINCSEITAFDKVFHFSGTKEVIPFELTYNGWRVPESEFHRRVSSILLGFRRNDYIVEYVDKEIENISHTSALINDRNPLYKVISYSGNPTSQITIQPIDDSNTFALQDGNKINIYFYDSTIIKNDDVDCEVLMTSPNTSYPLITPNTMIFEPETIYTFTFLNETFILNNPNSISALSSNVALALKNSISINGMSINGTASRINYAQATSNGAYIQATIEGMELVEGAQINIKIPASALVCSREGHFLNINNSADIPIYYLDNMVTGCEGLIWTAGCIYTLVLHDDKWNVIGIPENTHYTSRNVVGTSSTSITNEAAENQSVHINLIEGGNVSSSHNIKGTNGTTVTSDSSGNITIDTPVDSIVGAIPNGKTSPIPITSLISAIDSDSAVATYETRNEEKIQGGFGGLYYLTDGINILSEPFAWFGTSTLYYYPLKVSKYILDPESNTSRSGWTTIYVTIRNTTNLEPYIQSVYSDEEHVTSITIPNLSSYQFRGIRLGTFM